STATMDAQVTSARDEGKWRLLLVHGFTGGSDSAYQPVDLQAFTDSVDHAKAFGDVWIDSVVNVTAYWRAEKLLNGTTPANADGMTTWTWNLPEHFPPGKFLRVRVTGGTLEQNGKALVWDPHGYYEVALDAAALTLKP
ncbi:MAG TPA: polysaccharide deacetylase, partial [Polyangiaceae bacterium]|nr:polysaccharide deacetylase [Polyangiaceae bacterium]